MLLSYADIQSGNNIYCNKCGNQASEDGQRLAEFGQRWIVVCDDEVAIAELIDHVNGSKCELCSADGVKERPVQAGGVRDERNCGLELDVAAIMLAEALKFARLKDLHCAFRQDHACHDTLVLYSLVLLRSFQEWYFEHIAVARAPDELLDLAVPAHAELVVPATEDWISWLELEVRLARIRPEAGCRDVANVIGEVWIYASNEERELELLQRTRGWVVVVLLSPLHTREVVLQRCRAVREDVSLLGCNIAAPVTDLDVPLQR